MPNILILGGTGLLGTALSQSLLRAGTYEVFVQTRSASKTKALIAAELTPLVFSLEDETALRSALDDYEIHTVVDVSQGYQQSGSILNTIVAVANDRRAALAKEGSIGPKLGFVYTSGIWVHGSPTKRVSDLSPVGTSLATDKPPAMISWRPAHEQAVLAARDAINSVVIRPGSLYGSAAWNFDAWFGPVAALKTSGGNSLSIEADSTARAGLVHVGDAAEAYHAAIDRLDGRLGDWPVFDIVGETVDLKDIIDAALESQGLKAGVNFVGTGGNPVNEGLTLRSNINSARARTVLGWYPKRHEFLLNIRKYFAAWEIMQD